MNIDMLYDGYCVLTFTYEDGSEVKCVSTLNFDILDNLYLTGIDAIIDLLTYKAIPNNLFFDTTVSIAEGKEIKLDPLDKHFQSAIKRSWDNVV